MDSYRVHGYLDRVEAGAVTGWVRSEDRPDARIDVELLADDAVIAGGPANIYRSDLYVRARYDGQHAFQFRLAASDIPPGAQFIAVRDAATGRIFARRRVGPPRQFAEEAARLDDIERDLAALREMLDAPSPASRIGARLREGVGVVGRRLLATRDDPYPRVRERLETLLARCVFPFVGHPAFTVAVLARTVGEAAAAMERACALFARDRCEMLIVDLAGDPLIRLIPTIHSTIRVIDATPVGDVVEAMLRANSIARAGRLIVFDARIAPRADALVSPEYPLAFLDERLVLGPATPPSGTDDERVEPADGLSSLVFGIDRALFGALGGIEPRFGGDPPRAAAELGLRASLVGVPALRLAERPAGFDACAPTAMPAISGWSSLRMPTGSALR